MANVIDLTYDKKSINLDRLQEELAAALGSQFVGVSAGPQGLRIHIQADMPQVEQDQVAAIVAAHDASQLSTSQQVAVDRQAALDVLRKPWTEWTAQDQADFIRILAEDAGLIVAP